MKISPVAIEDITILQSTSWPKLFRTSTTYVAEGTVTICRSGETSEHSWEVRMETPKDGMLQFFFEAHPSLKGVKGIKSPIYEALLKHDLIAKFNNPPPPGS